MRHAARDKTGYLRSEGQGSLELPLHGPSHAYLGLAFHSLIKPFPFLVDSAVQNPSRAQLQGDQFTREPHMGYLSRMTSKGSKLNFYWLHRNYIILISVSDAQSGRSTLAFDFTGTIRLTELLLTSLGVSSCV